MKKIKVYCNEISCKHHDRNSKVFCDAEYIRINLKNLTFKLHGDVLAKAIKLKPITQYPVCCSYCEMK